MYRYILFEFFGTNTAYLVAEDDIRELEAVEMHRDDIVKRGEVLLDEPLPPQSRWFACASQPKRVNMFFLQMKYAGKNADYL